LIWSAQLRFRYQNGRLFAVLLLTLDITLLGQESVGRLTLEREHHNFLQESTIKHPLIQHITPRQMDLYRQDMKLR
jgi:hypothetical protein